MSETRRRLGQELQRLRDLAGLSGSQLARRLAVWSVAAHGDDALALIRRARDRRL